MKWDYGENTSSMASYNSKKLETFTWLKGPIDVDVYCTCFKISSMTDENFWKNYKYLGMVKNGHSYLLATRYVEPFETIIRDNGQTHVEAYSGLLSVYSSGTIQGEYCYGWGYG